MATPEKVTPERVKRLLSSFLVPETLDFEYERNPATPAKNECDKESHNKSNGQQQTSTNKEDASPAQKGPHPRSREAYFQRVHTFTTFNWFAKPVDLSPLVCARYGWQVIETDMLGCVGCKAKLSGQLPKTRDQQIYPDCCKKLKHGLTWSHKKSCSWSSNPSPESFAVIPLYNIKEIRQNFDTRLKILQACDSQLPVVTNRSMVKQGLDEEIIEDIVNYFLSDRDQPVTENSKAAFLLALCGWNLSDKGSTTLECSFCQRTIGLWNYKSSGGTQTTENEQEQSGDGPVAKKFKVTEKDNFDPIAEHRYWCSWLVDLSAPRDVSTPSKGSQGSQYSSPVCSPSTPNSSSFNSSFGEGSPGTSQLDLTTRPWFSMLKLVCPGKVMDTEPTMTDRFKQNSPTAGLRQLRRLMRGWSSAYIKSPDKPS
ncbi:nuclear-interacting partner of ALK-like [Mizuhopecten yessoensis]|uniref:Nuclear-interacting partner of ALK n=1 Tax=Mizuhopecten yessoensis TaxID=6573 RepID=A0A210Q4A8_MIZYE|nr:nuclear-interacting partner of ALK-like [Mizuhopecten yessoensis]OWF43574.1 Nuclear-interacting partner of ALK [Mizuhopecten yessoensis]